MDFLAVCVEWSELNVSRFFRHCSCWAVNQKWNLEECVVIGAFFSPVKRILLTHFKLWFKKMT